MPVYEYQGKHYELSETDPVKAKEKIVSFTGGAPKTEEKGLLAKAGDVITSAAEKLTTGVDIKKLLEKPEKTIAEAVSTDVSKKIGAPVVPTFKRDPSKAGSKEISDYASKAIEKGFESLVGGAGTSLVTGGGVSGAVRTAPLTFGAGALQGLIETGAEDLGFSPEAGQAFGVAVPSAPMLASGGAKGLSNLYQDARKDFTSLTGKQLPSIPQINPKQLVDNLLYSGAARESKINADPKAISSSIATEAATKLTNTLAEKAITKAIGVPSWLPSAVRPIYEKYVSDRPIDVSPITKELGAKPETRGVGRVEFQKQAKQKLSSEFPDVPAEGKNKVSSGLYERAAQAYDDVMQQNPFTESSQFKELTKGIPSLETKFKTLFQNQKGENLTGEDVVKNLRFKKYDSDVSAKNLEDAREAFNKFLDEQTGAKHEQSARYAYETERAAKAKDLLPSLFDRNKASAIGSELENLAKTNEGKQIFNNELSYYLKNSPASKSRALWGEIGEMVKEKMNIDDRTYRIITDAINKAKTKQEMDRATKMYFKAAVRGIIAKSEEESKTMNEE